MLACRDLLRLPVGAGGTTDGLGFANGDCDVQFDGQPPPICGEKYIAIHEGEWSSQYDEGRLDEIGISITVTRRVAYAPLDRGKTPLLEASDSLHLLIEAIAAKIHSNYKVLDLSGGSYGAAVWTGGQSYSLAATVNGFCRPLFWRGCAGTARKVGPEWFMADPTENDDNCPLGIVRTLTFGGAQRPQTIPSQS